ncbi:hypothetical protein R3P38DRAFT_1714099 [Favolaschia claudopus]|uniref:Uncharacterized protein n=1 Tax=Favolaschia claudopus TaxID=2862362 RepID=A0AAW0A980_9AGAR
MAGSRPRPPPLRLDHLGINPADLVGKVLKSVRRSSAHPAISLGFEDGTNVQIRVDGYDPIHPGLPKALEMDSSLSDLFATDGAVDLIVTDCALITLLDKAFARPTNDQWDQNHLGIAFKFGRPAGEPGPTESGWHCVWAMLSDHDATTGECVFRTYDDVYIDHLQRSPRKQKHRARRKSGLSSESPVPPWPK